MRLKAYVMKTECGFNPMVPGAEWVDVTFRIHFTPKPDDDGNPPGLRERVVSMITESGKVHEVYLKEDSDE